MARLIREFFSRHTTGTVKDIWVFAGEAASGWELSDIHRWLNEYLRSGHLVVAEETWSRVGGKPW